jgi:hypothetical protein
MHSLIIHDFSSHAPKPDKSDHKSQSSRVLLAIIRHSTSFLLLQCVSSKSDTSHHRALLIKVLSIPLGPWSLCPQTTTDGNNITSLRYCLHWSSTTGRLYDATWQIDFRISKNQPTSILLLLTQNMFSQQPSRLVAGATEDHSNQPRCPKTESASSLHICDPTSFYSDHLYTTQLTRSTPLIAKTLQTFEPPSNHAS